ncbi:hypothetical protein ACRAWD_12520 [Caulobacter segnis]
MIVEGDLRPARSGAHGLPHHPRAAGRGRFAARMLEATRTLN